MSLTIGKLARQANVNIETIRYYQRVGLLEEPIKPMVGYRVYPTNYVARLHFIKRAQKLGFTLKEITELLSLADGHCEDVRALAELKRKRIEEQIKDLRSIRQVLNQLIDACVKDHNTLHCSIIDALSDKVENS